MSQRKITEEVEVITPTRPQSTDLVEDLTGGTAVPMRAVPMPVAPIPTDGLTVTGSIEKIRQYAQAAEKLARGSLAMQVMAGFELSELRKSSPYVQGGGRKQSGHRGRIEENAPFSAYSTWESFLEGHLSLPVRTASRWIAMADAARPRLRKLDGFQALVQDLLLRPISSLTEEETAVLTKAVAKITDGRSQLDFMAELGLVKQPGNPNLGGATQGGGRKGGLAAEDKIREQAQEDWHTAERALVGGGNSFTLLKDSEIEAQLEVLMRAARVRREWLATPAAKRTPGLVDQIQKTMVGI